MARPGGELIYRQKPVTRITHWVWAVSLLFLMMSGLQIFNAFPSLHWGKESGFDYDNAFLKIFARQNGEAVEGVTQVFGTEFITTGILGYADEKAQAFPGAVTVPSYYSLAMGRLIHFFFAWVLVGTLALWLVVSALNGHLRQLIPTLADLKALPRAIADHARLRFHHSGRYNVLQKLAYAGVLFLALPLMIATGLSMSPSFNAAAP